MHRSFFKNLIVCIGIIVCVSACIKDKPNTNNTLPPTNNNSQKVLMVCEGSLGNGNSELGIYLPNKDSVYNNVFYNANQQNLGDVFQSIQHIGDYYFLCINNSDKIVVIDPKNWKEISNIAIPKPRYLLNLGNNKAYVGSLFSNKIYLIDTKNFSVLRQIDMPYQNSEGMVLHNNIVYACCWDTACNKIYKINPSTHQIFDSIRLGGNAPQSIIMDKNQNIWVMGGNAFKNKAAHLSCLNPDNDATLQFFEFSKGIEAIKPTINKDKDSLYFLEVNYNGGSNNNGLFRMPIQSSYLPTNPIVSCQSNQYFWALGINPIDGNIYLGDPKGFVQKSSVMIYNSAGLLQNTFNTGIGISSFYFD